MYRSVLDCSGRCSSGDGLLLGFCTAQWFNVLMLRRNIPLPSSRWLNSVQVDPEISLQCNSEIKIGDTPNYKSEALPLELSCSEVTILTTRYTIRQSAVCPHTVFICSVWPAPLHSHSCSCITIVLVNNTTKECVLCEVWTGSVYHVEEAVHRKDPPKIFRLLLLSFPVVFLRYAIACGLGSSVGIATELRAGQSGIESRWGWDFPPVQTGPGAHPAFCTMSTGSFPGVNCGRGVLLTTHPLLVPRSWKSRAITLPTLWATPGL